MGPDIPEEYKALYKLEKKDSGVDGLILKEDGSSVAYQVKFRTATEAPSYDDLTSFWAESEHTTERCIFANCYSLPKQACVRSVWGKVVTHQQKRFITSFLCLRVELMTETI